MRGDNARNRLINASAIGRSEPERMISHCISSYFIGRPSGAALFLPEIPRKSVFAKKAFACYPADW